LLNQVPHHEDASASELSTKSWRRIRESRHSSTHS